MSYLKSKDSHGMKWFTFYTKVLMILSIVFTGLGVFKYFSYESYYFAYGGYYPAKDWVLILAILAVLQTIFRIIVNAKSNGDYVDFVSFLKYGLVVEEIIISAQVAITLSAGKMFDTDKAILIFCCSLVIGFLVWYIPNIKYFKKRLKGLADTTNNRFSKCNKCGHIWNSHIGACPNCGSNSKTFLSNVDNEIINASPIEPSVEESVESTVYYCRKCGNKVVDDADFCHKCGTNVIRD